VAPFVRTAFEPVVDNLSSGHSVHSNTSTTDRSRPRGTYRLRCQSANTCHRHRQIALCSTTSASKRSALSSTSRPADTNPCFGCQQGRLLLLRAGRCLRSSTGQAAVHPQRHRPTRVLGRALRTHLPASPRPSLVAGPGTDSIPSLRSGIPLS